MLYVVGVDVLDDPYGHKVTFISKRTVGDACPYKYIISYVVGATFSATLTVTK